MKEIPLTQDKFALVSDKDYKYLSQWKWYALCNRGSYYAARKIRVGKKQTTLYMHQALAERLGFKHRADHVNQNGLDNRRLNLRDATNKQNAENQKLRKNNTSGHKGVYWDKQKSKWRPRICHNGRKISLGLFETLEDAIKARKEAEKKYFTHA